jgi:hypothetical protein
MDSGFLQSLRQVADGASLLWYQWVVEYDLERQIETQRSLGGFFKNLQTKGLMDKLTGRGSSSQEQLEEPAKERAGLPAWLVGLAVAAAVIALGIGFLRYRNRERGRGFDPVVDRAADKLARTLLKHGWRRESWETWRALAQRVEGDDPPIGQALAAFAAAYDRARYAADASAELRQAAAAAGKEAALLAAARPVAKG